MLSKAHEHIQRQIQRCVHVCVSVHVVCVCCVVWVCAPVRSVCVCMYVCVCLCVRAYECVNAYYVPAKLLHIKPALHKHIVPESKKTAMQKQLSKDK